MKMVVIVGVIAVWFFCLGFITGGWLARRDRHEDFKTTSDWEPDPLPTLNETALADLGVN